MRANLLCAGRAKSSRVYEARRRLRHDADSRYSRCDSVARKDARSKAPRAIGARARARIEPWKAHALAGRSHSARQLRHSVDTGSVEGGRAGGFAGGTIDRIHLRARSLAKGAQAGARRPRDGPHGDAVSLPYRRRRAAIRFRVSRDPPPARAASRIAALKARLPLWHSRWMTRRRWSEPGSSPTHRVIVVPISSRHATPALSTRATCRRSSFLRLGALVIDRRLPREFEQRRREFGGDGFVGSPFASGCKFRLSPWGGAHGNFAPAGTARKKRASCAPYASPTVCSRCYRAGAPSMSMSSDVRTELRTEPSTSSSSAPPFRSCRSVRAATRDPVAAVLEGRPP